MQALYGYRKLTKKEGRRGKREVLVMSGFLHPSDNLYYIIDHLTFGPIKKLSSVEEGRQYMEDWGLDIRSEVS